MAERILIVEGNRTRGQALSLLLGDLGGYDPVHVDTVVGAFKQLKRQQFDMVITNTQVERPADGIKLLQIVLLRGVVPQPPLIMVATLQRDRGLVQQCRRAGIVDYIIYPYDVEDLLKRVAAAFSAQREMSRNEVRRGVEATLKRILELPTISPITQKLELLLDDRETSASDVARVLEIDQSLTAKVLKLANSALFGFARQITAITDAVSLIGFRQVADLIAVVSTFESLGRIQDSPQFDRRAFWEHAIGCGIIAKVIGEHRAMDLSRTFVAGILHDIGKVIMDAFFPEYFHTALSEARAEGISIFAAEQRSLPVTHEEVGRHLAVNWQFPEPLVEAIGAHHSLAHRKRAHARLTELIHIADAQCRILGIGNGGDQAVWAPKALVMKNVGVTNGDLEAWRDEMMRQVDEALSVMQV